MSKKPWSKKNKNSEKLGKNSEILISEFFLLYLQKKENNKNMGIAEITPGVKVRHTSGKEETIIAPFKIKVNGEWKEAVLYQGYDRETGETALFGREKSDFVQNFEVAGERGDVLEYLVMNFSLDDLKKAAKAKGSICFIKK